MADYFKLSLAATYSANSDYSDPKLPLNIAAYETRPTEFSGQAIVNAATAGSTIAFSGYLSTSAAVVLKNKDTTNYVQVGWTDVSTTACVARIPAGGILVIPAVNPATSLVLTANTAAVLCDLLVVQNS